MSSKPAQIIGFARVEELYRNRTQRAKELQKE
jgi:hypothetical protein